MYRLKQKIRIDENLPYFFVRLNRRFVHRVEHFHWLIDLFPFLIPTFGRHSFVVHLYILQVVVRVQPLAKTQKKQQPIKSSLIQ